MASFSGKDRYGATLETEGGSTIAMAGNPKPLQVPRRFSGFPGSWVIARYGPSALMVFFCAACAVASPQNPDAPEDFATIRFDLSRLNDNGLYGPPNGLRALDYEFCIPSGEPYVKEVTAIDPSASFHSRSRGRIGCTEDQDLVIGNTHQTGFREILGKLAALPYVTRIDQSFFE